MRWRALYRDEKVFVVGACVVPIAGAGTLGWLVYKLWK
jgi:hypothetical protein